VLQVKTPFRSVQWGQLLGKSVQVDMSIGVVVVVLVFLEVIGIVLIGF